MTRKLLIVIAVLFSMTIFAEPPYGITQLSATNAVGGINLNIKVLSSSVCCI